MKIDLVPAADHHAEALAEYVRAFVQEVGYYLGRTRDEDGAFQLTGLTDRPVVHSGRYVIEQEGQPIGFLDVARGTEEGGKALTAIYVATGWRRRRAASEALELLFIDHPGTWSLTVSPRFEPGMEFARATLGRFAWPGSTTRRSVRAGKETLRRLTFSAGPLDGPLAPTGHEADFEFDRSHHKDRRILLVGAIASQVAGGGLGLLAVAGDSPFMAFFFTWAGGAAALVFGLMYLERVVTGLLDRLDRGPIVKPAWMVRDELKD